MVSDDAGKLEAQLSKPLLFSVGRPGVGRQSRGTTGAAWRVFADGQRARKRANGAGLAILGIESGWDRLRWAGGWECFGELNRRIVVLDSHDFACHVCIDGHGRGKSRLDDNERECHGWWGYCVAVHNLSHLFLNGPYKPSGEREKVTFCLAQAFN